MVSRFLFSLGYNGANERNSFTWDFGCICLIEPSMHFYQICVTIRKYYRQVCSTNITASYYYELTNVFQKLFVSFIVFSSVIFKWNKSTAEQIQRSQLFGRAPLINVTLLNVNFRVFVKQIITQLRLSQELKCVIFLQLLYGGWGTKEGSDYRWFVS